MTDTRALALLIEEVGLDLCDAGRIALLDKKMPEPARREGLIVRAELARDRLNEILKGEGDG